MEKSGEQGGAKPGGGHASILDASDVADKMAELMVDLKGMGIQRSRGYHPRPQPEVLAALKKVMLDASFTPKSQKHQ